MTIHTAHATHDVRRVIEERVVGQVVHAHPLDGTSGFPTLLERLDQLTLGMNHRVTVHARLRRWNGRMCRDFNGVVAVPTVDAQFARVLGMREGNRLLWLVANIGRFRTESPRHNEGDIQRRNGAEDGGGGKNQVRPLWKNVVVSAHEQVPRGLREIFHEVQDLEFPRPAVPCQGGATAVLRGSRAVLQHCYIATLQGPIKRV